MKIAAPSQNQKPHRMNTYLSRFVADEAGNLVIFGVYIFVVIFMVAGVGIDLMRLERDRTNLQYTLDRAVLAATDLEQELDPTFVVREYLQKAGFLQNLQSVSVEQSEFSREVIADVDGEMVTQFMHMNGLDLLSIGAVSAARENVPSSEISLLLDISGSMRTNNRVDRKRKAAKEFVTEALDRNVDDVTGAVNPHITTINVIPFAGQTNPGPEIFEYLGGERFGTTTSEDYFPEWAQDISNVVFWFDTDGDGELDYSAKIDDYPDNEVAKFNKDDLDTYYEYAADYLIKSNPELDGTMELIGASIKGGVQKTTFYSVTGEIIDGPTKFKRTDDSVSFEDIYKSLPSDFSVPLTKFENDLVPNNTSSCLEMTRSDFTEIGLPDGTTAQTPHFVNWDFDNVTQNWGWCPDDGMAIQYANRDETELHAFIDGLRLFDGTGTNYGMKYALALLDPSTQPAFEYLSTLGVIENQFATRPLAWDADESAKYIVLMTDGSTSTQYRPTDTLDETNSEMELTHRDADESFVASSSSSNRDMFLAQCDLAKDTGVIIYTVAVEMNSWAAEEVRECASSAAHYFEVGGDEVIETFVSIASSIQRLRLIQQLRSPSARDFRKSSSKRLAQAV